MGIPAHVSGGRHFVPSTGWKPVPRQSGGFAVGGRDARATPEHGQDARATRGALR
ncbi:MAG: hypothetical protein LBK99_24375 [Opitutaceae bacterium]|nr:hypothetical protein [Opitutaceae bacterium]